MKKRVKIAIISLLVLVVPTIIYFTFFSSNGLADLKAVEINVLQLETIEDGTYKGLYEYNDNVYASVEVTILNHEITIIDVIENTSSKADLVIEIPIEIIDAQSLQIDDVTGATISSRIVILAVQNALVDIDNG